MSHRQDARECRWACGAWRERDAHAANEKGTFSGNKADQEVDVWKEGDGGGGKGRRRGRYR